jgi:hypothetical protein
MLHQALQSNTGSELETIERLVDIGHYEVQVTPDNCAATLISVDQIVEDGHMYGRREPVQNCGKMRDKKHSFV